jgi:hypothetical protein
MNARKGYNAELEKSTAQALDINEKCHISWNLEYVITDLGKQA